MVSRGLKMSGQGRLLVVSGPSGAGKSTIIQTILKKHTELVYSISYTTRQPRGNERHGVEYCFVGEDVFQGMIDNGEFVEWAYVHGHYYGTPAAFIEKTTASGRDVMLDIDVEGAKKFMTRYPEAVLIFIAPPDLETLERRLVERASDAPEVVSRRLENAKKEMAQSDRYDYILVNRDLDKAISELEGMIGKRP